MNAIGHIGQTLPPLTTDAPDDVLRAHLALYPSLVQTAQVQATRARDELLRTAMGKYGVWQYWRRMQSKTFSTIPQGVTRDMAADRENTMRHAINQLRVAMEARDLLQSALRAFKTLTALEIAAFVDDNPPFAFSFRGPKARAVLDRKPGLAAWQAMMKAEAERLTAIQRALEEQHAQKNADAKAAIQAGAIAHLLGYLANRGITLSVAKGQLMARPAGLLTPQESASIEALRPELIAALSAPAEVV